MIDLNNFKAVNFVQPEKQASEYHMGLNRIGIRFNKAIAKYFNVSNSKPANLQFLIDQENKQLVITNCKRAQATTCHVKPAKSNYTMNISWSKRNISLKTAFSKLGFTLQDEIINDDFDNLSKTLKDVNHKHFIMSPDVTPRSSVQHVLDTTIKTKALYYLISYEMLQNDPNWRINFDNLQKLIIKYPTQFEVIYNDTKYYYNDTKYYLRINLNSKITNYMKKHFINYSSLYTLIGIRDKATMHIPVINSGTNYVVSLLSDNKSAWADGNYETDDNILSLRRNYIIYLKEDQIDLNGKTEKCLFVDLKDKDQLLTNESLVLGRIMTSIYENEL